MDEEETINRNVAMTGEAGEHYVFAREQQAIDRRVQALQIATGLFRNIESALEAARAFDKFLAEG